MIGIKCRSGKFFSACKNDYVDAEWKLQEAYYKAQGCAVEESEENRRNIQEWRVSKLK